MTRTLGKADMNGIEDIIGQARLGSPMVIPFGMPALTRLVRIATSVWGSRS